MMKTYDLNFSDKHEPESFRPEFELAVIDYIQEKDKNVIVVKDFRDADDYYPSLERIRASYWDTCSGEFEYKNDGTEEDVETVYIK